MFVKFKFLFFLNTKWPAPVWLVYLSQINKINVIFYCTTGAKDRQENTSSSSSLTGLFEETCILVGIQFSFIIMASTSKAFNKCVDPCPRYLRWHTQSLRLLFGQGARTRCPWGENLCATSSTFAGRRHMIGKVVTGCVAILSYHTATQDRGSECRDFGFISRIVTALLIYVFYSSCIYFVTQTCDCSERLMTFLCFAFCNLDSAHIK